MRSQTMVAAMELPHSVYLALHPCWLLRPCSGLASNRGVPAYSTNYRLYNPHIPFSRLLDSVQNPKYIYNL